MTTLVTIIVIRMQLGAAFEKNTFPDRILAFLKAILHKSEKHHVWRDYSTVPDCVAVQYIADNWTGAISKTLPIGWTS